MKELNLHIVELELTRQLNEMLESGNSEGSFEVIECTKDSFIVKFIPFIDEYGDAYLSGY